MREIDILRAMLDEEGLEMAVFKSDYAVYYRQLMTAPGEVYAQAFMLSPDGVQYDRATTFGDRAACHRGNEVADILLVLV